MNPKQTISYLVGDDDHPHVPASLLAIETQ